MPTAGSSQIRGILFDKDGTLVDFNRTWFGITMELAHKAADGDEARARALVEAGGYDWEMEKFRGGSVIAAGTVNDIVDLWHPELTLEEKRARISAYNAYAVQEGSRRAIGIEGLHVTLEALVAARVCSRHRHERLGSRRPSNGGSARPDCIVQRDYRL